LGSRLPVLLVVSRWAGAGPLSATGGPEEAPPLRGPAPPQGGGGNPQATAQKRDPSPVDGDEAVGAYPQSASGNGGLPLRRRGRRLKRPPRGLGPSGAC